MRVLVTGAAGLIGRAFTASCEGGGLQPVRADLHDGDPRSPFPFRSLDVTDEAACHDACRDVEAVVHLAADPSPDAPFRTSALPLNIVGTYNMAAAAVAAGVARFVFASSIQAVEGYPPDRQVRETDAPWPANDYGVSKAFGEALCASLAVRSATAFVAVRIGNYEADRPGRDASVRSRAAWVSPRDANQILSCAVTRDTPGFLVAHGSSDNASKRLAINDTVTALGYEPVDDAFAAVDPADGGAAGERRT